MLETDVLVVGSGAAGMTAAITARRLGFRVIVIEKTGAFGGTTAYSGGALWIPGNHVEPQFGVEDSRADSRSYLKAVLGAAFSEELSDSFLEQAPQMLLFMEECLQTRFIPYALPDYESHLPGAKTFRSLLTPEFDGRRLGVHLDELRRPLPQMMLFDSMQIDGSDIRPMRNALRRWKGFQHTVKILSRYALDRAWHRRGMRLANGNALVARLFSSALGLGAEFWKDTPAVELLLGEEGTVRGVTALRDGQRVELQARCGVVLASGGFGANKEMRAKFLPFAEAHHSLQADGCVGDGIGLGVSAGGYQNPVHAGDCVWTPMSVLRRPNGQEVVYPHTFLDRSMPGCIAVAPNGKRFVNEGTSYQSFVEVMHALGLAQVHLISDQSSFARYGLGLAKPFPFNPSTLIAAGYLKRAETLDALARQIGVDPSALQDTVRDFNVGAALGRDPEFGKGDDPHSRFRGDPEHAPNPGLAPLGRGPYFSVALSPGSLCTMGGLEVNGKAQVLRSGGEPIPGLYAVGADMNSVMRGHYPGGGSSLGPAMTFAYIAANHLAQAAGEQAGG